MTLDYAVIVLSAYSNLAPAAIDLAQFDAALRTLAAALEGVGPNDPLRQSLSPLYASALTQAEALGYTVTFHGIKSPQGIRRGISGVGERLMGADTGDLVFPLGPRGPRELVGLPPLDVATTPTPTSTSPPGAIPTFTRGAAAPGAGAALTGLPQAPPPPFEQQAGLAPIGVPPGYIAPAAIDPRQSPEAARALGTSRTHARPRYFPGDEALPATLDTTEVRRLQKELERSGLLKRNTYIPGFWDNPSQEAYYTALAYANQSGDHVRDTLTRLATMPKPPEPAQPREVRQFTPSDPAVIAQEVKATFRQRLGREPRPEELNVMSAHLGVFEQLAFEAESQVLANQFEAQEQAMAEEDAFANRPGPLVEGIDPHQSPEVARVAPPVGPDGGPFVTLPASPAAVDPVAGFLEEFDRRYGPEVARNQAVAETATQYRNVMASLVTMQSLVG